MSAAMNTNPRNDWDEDRKRIFLYLLGAPFFLIFLSAVVRELLNWLNLDLFKTAFFDPMRYGFPIFYLSLWVMFLVIPWSFVLFGRIAELLGYAVNSTYQVLFAMTIGVIAVSYLIKKLSRGIKLDFQLEKLESLLLPPKRITQLLSSNVQKTYFEHLNDDVWFDIVSYISNPVDGARSHHQKHPWLECFILPLNEKVPSEVSEFFQSAHIKFELAPTEFILHVERFSELLKIRDLCQRLLGWIENSTNEDQRYSKLHFWISLQAEIYDIVQSGKSSSTASTQVQPSETLDRIQSSLRRFRDSGVVDSFSSAAKHLQNFLKRSIDVKELQISETIEKSWQEEHQRFLKDRFDAIENQSLLKTISSLLNKWSADPRVLSLEQDKFQSNVCLFVEAKAGRKGLTYREAIQTLRQMSYVKNEQWKVLYEEIERQKSEISLQQQIITCLEFRRVLENLPNRKYEAIFKKGTDSTPVWKATWKLAIENELENMIKIYIISKNLGRANGDQLGSTGENQQLPASANPPGPSSRNQPEPANENQPQPASEHQSEPASENQPESANENQPGPTSENQSGPAGENQSMPTNGHQPKTAIGNQQHSTSENELKPANENQSELANENQAGSARGDQPVPENGIQRELVCEDQPGSSSSRLRPLLQREFDYWAGKKLSEVTSLEQDSSKPGSLPHLRRYNPPYHDWSIFQRGLTMYNELSSTIHQYGKSYTVYENNWAKSDRLIFEWLRPTVNTLGEVNWDREWSERGLPPSSISSTKLGDVSKKKQDEVVSNSILDADGYTGFDVLFGEGEGEGEVKVEAETGAEAETETETETETGAEK